MADEVLTARRGAVLTITLNRPETYNALNRAVHDALREALAIRDGDRRQMDASRWMERHYDRGRVLVAPAVNVSPRTRIPLRDRIYPWTWQLGDSALARPAAVVDWVILDRQSATDPVTAAVVADTGFTERFLLAFEEQGLEIWQRR